MDRPPRWRLYRRPQAAIGSVVADKDIGSIQPEGFAMKRIALGALVLAALAAAVPALAAGPLDVNAGLGLHSQYVWRGQIVNPEAVLQPELGISVLGLSFGMWGNVDLSDVNGYETSLSETDWTVGYHLSLPLVSLGAGFVYYDYPTRGPNDTTELYVGGEVNVPFSPHLWISKDIDQVKGTYVNVGGAWSRELGSSTALDLGLDLGYSSEGYVNRVFGGDSAGMSDLTITASVPWRPLPLLTVRPHVSFATLLGDAKDLTDERDADTSALWYGVSARVSF
jgi:uncharacterized protein (TIGR02001 family)